MSKPLIIVKKSNRKGKKWMAEFPDKSKIHFGASGYQDYTIHKDRNRMIRYLNRHKTNENWSKSGIKTAGFWSRYLLWNLPSLNASKKDIEKRFNVLIKLFY